MRRWIFYYFFLFFVAGCRRDVLVIIVYCRTRLRGNQVVRLPIKHPAGKRQMNRQTGEERDSSGLFIAQPWIVGGPIPLWCMAPVSTPGARLCAKSCCGSQSWQPQEWACHNIGPPRTSPAAEKAVWFFVLLFFCAHLRNVAGRTQRWVVAMVCQSNF